MKNNLEQDFYCICAKKKQQKRRRISDALKQGFLTTGARAQLKKMMSSPI